MLTIVLADDHPIVRQGLRTVLAAEAGWNIVGEAADGPTVLELVAELQPNVLIVDIMMPGLNGIEVTRQLSRRSPQTHIIIFSMHANNAYIREGITSGASGYVLKDADSDELIQAVREAMAGRRYLSRALAERAIESYLQHASDESLDWLDMLTAREQQVLRLVAHGSSNAVIASQLAISPRTVETHRANLMRKLGLKTQADLIRYALQHGLLLPYSQ